MEKPLQFQKFAVQLHNSKKGTIFSPTYHLYTDIILYDGYLIGLKDTSIIDDVKFIFENLTNVYVVDSVLTQINDENENPVAVRTISEEPIPLHLFNKNMKLYVSISFNNTYSMNSCINKFFELVVFKHQKKFFFDSTNIIKVIQLLNSHKLEIIDGYVRII